MDRQMFQAQPGTKRKWYALPLAVMGHLALILAMLVVPILVTDIPSVQATLSFKDIELPKVVKAEVAPRPKKPVNSENKVTAPAPNPNNAPIESPNNVRPEIPGPKGNFPNNPIPDICLSNPENCKWVNNPLPPPPGPPGPGPGTDEEKPQKPIPVGGNIKAPTKVRHVSPNYPAIAQSARVEGIVIIEAIINTNGRVVQATVLRSVPLLDQAALDAVRQWEFTPTLLNGQPVSVVMTVTVNFTLR